MSRANSELITLQLIRAYVDSDSLAEARQYALFRDRCEAATRVTAGRSPVAYSRDKSVADYRRIVEQHEQSIRRQLLLDDL